MVAAEICNHLKAILVMLVIKKTSPRLGKCQPWVCTCDTRVFPYNGHCTAEG